MKILGLGYVGLETPEAKQWAEFGPEVLAMEVGTGDCDDTVYLRMDDKHHRIAVRHGERSRIAHLGWELRDGESFESAKEELQRAGIGFETATDAEISDRCVRDLIHLTDPCGYRHELFYGQGWQWRSYAPARPHEGFVTGDAGMGHAVLFGREGDEFHDWATRLLGFSTVDHVKFPGVGSMGFYRTGYRHHSVALFNFGPVRGLHHLMVECSDLDDVGRTWALCRERGIPIPIDLGRHRGDEMLSFYVEAPGGIFLEYGWGGVRADEAFVEREVAERPFGPGEPGTYWGHQPPSGLPQALVRPRTAIDESTEEGN